MKFNDLQKRPAEDSRCAGGAFHRPAGRRPGGSTTGPQDFHRYLWTRVEERSIRAGQPARSGYWKFASRFCSTALNSESRCRIPSIFWIEWMTVEWCLPPNALPISGSEARVSALHMYIAT